MRIINRVIVFVLLISIFNANSIANLIHLTDNGVFAEAKVIRYAPYTVGKSLMKNYVISYDNYTGDIILWGKNHPINSKVSVVYDKTNSCLVWLGNPGDSSWELYKSNYDPKYTIVAIIIFVVLCAAEKVYIFSEN